MSTLLGEELRRLREQKGLTLEQVASRTGVTKQYLSLLENGHRKSLSFEIIINISEFYGVPLDYFKNFVHPGEVHNSLPDKDLSIWQLLNEKITQEIYFKNGDDLKKYILSKIKESNLTKK